MYHIFVEVPGNLLELSEINFLYSNNSTLKKTSFANRINGVLERKEKIFYVNNCSKCIEENFLLHIIYCVVYVINGNKKLCNDNLLGTLVLHPYKWSNSSRWVYCWSNILHLEQHKSCKINMQIIASFWSFGKKVIKQQ